MRKTATKHELVAHIADEASAILTGINDMNPRKYSHSRDTIASALVFIQQVKEILKIK